MKDFDYSIIKIIERMLSYVDPRLVNHGKRVAYLTYKALRGQGHYSEEYLRNAAILGLIHDIGAYKTEEIDKMLQFETNRVWGHSIYGYLFTKYFSPLYAWAPAIFFHHASMNELTYLTPSLRELAQVIHVADRLDILMQIGNEKPEAIVRHFASHRGGEFDPHVLDMFFTNGWETLTEDIEDNSEFERALYDGSFNRDNIEAFTRMAVLSIDFRSPQTVAHSFTATIAATYLSRAMNLDRPEADRIYTGTMLHDLGKIGVPTAILEKNDTLTGEEMRKMQCHVALTEEILSGLVDDVTLQLAARHHEKINGAGYPRGLCREELTPGQRIVAVADIFSALSTARSYKEPFPKEKVLKILNDMAAKDMLDVSVVEAAAAHFDDMRDEINRVTSPIIDAYELIEDEYATLMEWAQTFPDGKGTGEIAI